MNDPCGQSREMMVKSQLERRGISNPDLLGAFRAVPRHEFVPPTQRRGAYADRPLPLGWGQTISQPYIVALMTQMAGPAPGDRALEIGTGSGYQAAILAQLGCRVFSVERIPELLARAGITLKNLGYGEIRLREDDGTLGWSEAAPFDLILVTAGSPGLPQPLLEQLAPGGRLVLPLEEKGGQVLYRVTRTETGSVRERGDLCAFVPLIGRHGWPRDPRPRS